jgi:peptidoglycan hydrolase CwlO-like protein
MTPDREKNMRMNLAELTQEQLSDTCVQLQTVIDKHVSEKQGMKSQVTAMGNQVNALQEKIAQLEADADDTTRVGSVELEAMNAEIAKLKQRNIDLTNLNEGLQKAIVKSSMQG